MELVMESLSVVLKWNHGKKNEEISLKHASVGKKPYNDLTHRFILTLNLMNGRILLVSFETDEVWKRWLIALESCILKS